MSTTTTAPTTTSTTFEADFLKVLSEDITYIERIVSGDGRDRADMYRLFRELGPEYKKQVRATYYPGAPTFVNGMDVIAFTKKVHEQQRMDTVADPLFITQIASHLRPSDASAIRCMSRPMNGTEICKLQNLWYTDPTPNGAHMALAFCKDLYLRGKYPPILFEGGAAKPVSVSPTNAPAPPPTATQEPTVPLAITGATVVSGGITGTLTILPPVQSKEAPAVVPYAAFMPTKRDLILPMKGHGKTKSIPRAIAMWVTTESAIPVKDWGTVIDATINQVEAALLSDKCEYEFIAITANKDYKGVTVRLWDDHAISLAEEIINIKHKGSLLSQ